MIGTWVQSVALMWLAYRLSGSTGFTGLVGFLQSMPHLVLAPFAGVLGDRVNRRKLLITVLTLLALQSAALAILTGTGHHHAAAARGPRALRGRLQRLRDADAPVDLRAAPRQARGPAQRDRAELDADERHAPHRPVDRRAADRGVRRDRVLRDQRGLVSRGAGRAEGHRGRTPRPRARPRTRSPTSPRAGATRWDRCPCAACCSRSRR